MEFFILFLALAFPAAVILLPLYWRGLERRQLIAVVRQASERGEPVPVELLDALTRGLSTKSGLTTPQQDFRRGIFLLAIALGLGLIGVGAFFGVNSMEGAQGALPTGIIIASLGAIPGCVGIAYIVLGLQTRIGLAP